MIEPTMHLAFAITDEDANDAQPEGRMRLQLLSVLPILMTRCPTTSIA
jgi:hypothetical protein